jgi:hypothetical protein
VRRLWTTAGAAALLVASACGGGSSHGDAAVFCTRLERLSQNDPFRVFGSRATNAEIKTAFQALVQRSRDLAAVAPTEVQPTAEAYESAARRMDSLMAGAGYDGSLVDATAYRAAQVDYTTASTRLVRYLTTSCPPKKKG